MLNIIKARSESLTGGNLIDLDVEGFIYPEIEGDDGDEDNETTETVDTTDTTESNEATEH